DVGLHEARRDAWDEGIDLPEREGAEQSGERGRDRPRAAPPEVAPVPRDLRAEDVDEELELAGVRARLVEEALRGDAVRRVDDRGVEARDERFEGLALRGLLPVLPAGPGGGEGRLLARAFDHAVEESLHRRMDQLPLHLRDGTPVDVEAVRPPLE